MSTALATIGNKLSSRFGMGDNTQEVMEILKATAFKGANVSDAQMTSLMVVADQYGLNPFTKEIYAFPDKGGIVPVVGVDGWSRIINEHPQFDGLEFDQNDESCTCIIYRKDRSHAIKVTEWMAECKRENAQPWKSHPRRMLRHKTLIQCARLAFGFVGIYDQDEAERIAEIDVTPRRETGTQAASKVKRTEISDADKEKRANIIADLELVRIESGKEAFRTAWKSMTAEHKELVSLAERDRIDALGNEAIEGESTVIEGESHE